jgi:uncharacterized protein (TIGR03083 family)
MTELANRTVAALRTNHDDLVGRVAALSDSELTGPSGATEWPVAQVLSHLGSGAEIAMAGLQAVLRDEPMPDQGFNEGVWDRWNAMTPHQQATGFLEHDGALVAVFEGLDESQLGTLQVKLGFLPHPLSIESFLGMRLNEAALHSWDVRVARDPSATVAPDAADALVEHLSGGLGFLLGFTGKADAVTERVVLALPAYEITIDDTVALSAGISEPTARFEGDREQALRLVSGRLREDVDVTGNVTLAELRQVFPGY